MAMGTTVAGLESLTASIPEGQGVRSALRRNSTLVRSTSVADPLAGALLSLDGSVWGHGGWMNVAPPGC
jgi:hypothetical protein